MPAEVTTTVNQVLINLILVIITLLAALISLYVQKGIKKLQAETEKIKDEGIRNLIDTALIRLNDVTEKTVNAIEQTVKKDLLKAIEDGTIDRSELKNLSVQAYNEIVTILEPEYMDIITDSMGNAEKYIMNLIEDKLKEIKLKQTVIDLGTTSIEVTS